MAAPSTAVVENVFPEHARVVFVLESPHVEEVAHGYPLAGHAGRTMSSYLFGRRDVPFGLIARHHRALVSLLKLPRKKPYAVMNVSREPLQRAAYTNNGLRLPPSVDVRMTLKRALDRGAKFSAAHRDRALNRLKAQLYSDFEDQSSNLARGTELVPCGNFARAYCGHLVEKHPHFVFRLEDVPHPAARGGWAEMSPATLTEIRRLLE